MIFKEMQWKCLAKKQVKTPIKLNLKSFFGTFHYPYHEMELHFSQKKNLTMFFLCSTPNKETRLT